MGLVPCHIGLLGMRSACCESQSKIKDFCQLPLAREPLVQVFGFSLLRTHIIPLSKYQPSIYGLRRVAADNFAR